MGIVKDGGSKGFQGRNPREDSNLSPSHFEVKVLRKLNRKKGTKGAKALKAFTCLCFMCLFVARKSRPRLQIVDGFGELLGLASEPTEPP